MTSQVSALVDIMFNIYIYVCVIYMFVIMWRLCGVQGGTMVMVLFTEEVEEDTQLDVLVEGAADCGDSTRIKLQRLNPYTYAFEAPGAYSQPLHLCL